MTEYVIFVSQIEWLSLRVQSLPSKHGRHAFSQIQFAHTPLTARFFLCWTQFSSLTNCHQLCKLMSFYDSRHLHTRPDHIIISQLYVNTEWEFSFVMPFWISVASQNVIKWINNGWHFIQSYDKRNDDYADNDPSHSPLCSVCPACLTSLFLSALCLSRQTRPPNDVLSLRGRWSDAFDEMPKSGWEWVSREISSTFHWEIICFSYWFNCIYFMKIRSRPRLSDIETLVWRDTFVLLLFIEK